MARKSPWQEFAENFDAVYGTFQKVGKNIETSRITGDEFTEEGGLGFDESTGKALEGDALERARYKALGDIYTKYGEADKGLAIRQQLMNLEETRRANDIAAATLQEQIRQTGILKSNIMASQANVNNAKASDLSASAGLKNFDLNQKVDTKSALKVVTDQFDAWVASQGVGFDPNSKEANTMLQNFVMKSNLPIESRLEYTEKIAAVGSQRILRAVSDMQGELKGALFNGYTAPDGKKYGPGIDGLIGLYDTIDGKDTTLKISDDGTKLIKINVKDKSEEILIEANDRKMLQVMIENQLGDPGNTIGLMDNWLSLKKKEAEIADIEKGTEVKTFTMEIEGKKFDVSKKSAEFNDKLTAQNTTLAKIRGEVLQGELSNSSQRIALDESRLAWQKEKTKKDQEIAKINADASALNASTNADLAASQKLLTIAKQGLTNAQVSQVEANTAKVKAQTKGLSNTGLTLKDVSKAFLELKVSDAYLLAETAEEQEAMESMFWNSFPNLIVGGAVPGINSITKIE